MKGERKRLFIRIEKRRYADPRVSQLPCALLSDKSGSFRGIRARQRRNILVRKRDSLETLFESAENWDIIIL